VNDQKNNICIGTEAKEISSRRAQTDLTPNEDLLEIDRLNRMESSYSPFEEFIAVEFICGFFAILFQGNFNDLIAAAITGSIGYVVYLYSKKLTNIRFFSELLGALTIGWIALFLTNLSIGNDVNIIIVASIMTLVPGKAITNGIRDLMASHFISGVSVLADALLTASAIGIGISTVLSFI